MWRRINRFRSLPINLSTNNQLLRFTRFSLFSASSAIVSQYSLLYSAYLSPYPITVLSFQRKFNITGDIIHITIPRTYTSDFKSQPISKNIKSHLSLPSVDPDLKYITDDISTNASLSAFAEFELKQKKKNKLQIKQRTEAEIATEVAAAVDVRMTNSVDGTSLSLTSKQLKESLPLTSTRPDDPESNSLEDELATVSMDAFAEMEKKMALERRKVNLNTISICMKIKSNEVATSKETSTPSTLISSISASTTPSSTIPSSPPVAPQAWECCGHDCPNCVWIVYSEQLAAYEEQHLPTG